MTGPVRVCEMSDRCPLWVKSGHSAILDGCPLYPQERTLASVGRRAFGAENSLLVARFETKSIRWLARAASMRGSKNSYRPPLFEPSEFPWAAAGGLHAAAVAWLPSRK